MTKAAFWAPAEVVAALDCAKPQPGGGIRGYCPYCDPEGRKRDGGTLWAGERGWMCHRGCHQDIKAAQRTTMFRAKLQRHDQKIDKKRNQELALRLYEQSRAITDGDPVDRYLRQRRLLVPTTGVWPAPLRRARLKHPQTKRQYWAMLAVVVTAEREFAAVHRTFVMDDGRRADDPTLPDKVRVVSAKLSLGPLLGNAVRLGDDSDTIGICEGIESALGFAQATSLTCWSTISAAGMRAVTLPKSVSRVVIGPDVGDERKDGLKAALRLRERLLRTKSGSNQQLIVEIKPPPMGCYDWADRPGEVEVGE